MSVGEQGTCSRAAPYLPALVAVLMLGAIILDQQRVAASGRAADGSPTPGSATPSPTVDPYAVLPTVTSTPTPLHTPLPTSTSTATSTPVTMLHLPLVVRTDDSSHQTFLPLLLRPAN